MDIVPVRRQYQTSRMSLLYRLCGTFCVVGLVCLVIMATRAYAAESATGEVSPESSTSQQQAPPAKKQTPDNPKKASPSTTIDAAKGRKVAASDADSALLIAAGAEIIDKPTVKDQNLISATSGEAGISDLLEMLGQALKENTN